MEEDPLLYLSNFFEYRGEEEQPVLTTIEEQEEEETDISSVEVSEEEGKNILAHVIRSWKFRKSLEIVSVD